MKKTLTAILVVMAISPMAALGFSGMLSTSGGGLTGTGTWAEDFMISWQVYQMGDNSWYYEYSLTGLSGQDLRKAVSHLTVEISPNVPETRFWGFSLDGADVEFGSIEGIDNAMKLDWEATTYSYYSSQAPVWGDFYAKGGTDEFTSIELSIWNTGFGNPDPTAAPADGTIDNKILRPDTFTGVPEPGTMLLFGLGLAGVGLRKRFFK